MKKEQIIYLICPSCQRELFIKSIEKESNSRIETGLLECKTCNATYPILKNIPRFVPLDNYCDSFGYEWLTHPKTQYDDDTGVNISEKRFFDETEWPQDMQGQVILEAGSGSGRFTL